MESGKRLDPAKKAEDAKEAGSSRLFGCRIEQEKLI
jgi:hypothetical protein